MPRPIWKGYITFGLVNIPVVLYSGEKKFDIRFQLLDSRDKSKVRYLRVNEKTGEEVPWQEIVKGYEYDENNYVLLDEKELKQIAGEHSKTIDIEAFISKSSISCMQFDRPYYLVPDKKGEKGYVILRETLSDTKKVGIAKVIIHMREYLAALMPYQNALLLNLLHYQQELRRPEEFDLPAENLKEYKINSKEIEVAKQLVESMTTKWDPDVYHDNYRDALRQWIEDKVHHEKPRSLKSRKVASSSNVINFVDLLQKSLKTQKGKKASPSPAKRKPRRGHKKAS
jgi:DNA end-binding protein Ku